MDDMDRQFIRAQIMWRELQRLGVSSINCECKESNPACFMPDGLFGIKSGLKAQGTCANCGLKKLAVEKPELVQVRITKLEKHGLKNCRCICGESHPLCLDVEHVDGQKFSDEVYALCRNCHLKRTARQLSEHAGFWLDSKIPLVNEINKIGSVADYLEFATAHLREVEDFLFKLVIKGIDSPQG
jgi:hypothetical protein